MCLLINNFRAILLTLHLLMLRAMIEHPGKESRMIRHENLYKQGFIYIHVKTKVIAYRRLSVKDYNQ